MKRGWNIFWVCLMIAVAVVTYAMKDSAGRAADHVMQLRAEIAREKQQLAVLKAEWGVLDQPSRLQVLVERYADYLGLKPLDVHQLARLDDIPGRGPMPVGNGKTPGKPLDLLTASAASGVDPVRTGSVATTPKLPKPPSSKTAAAKSAEAAKTAASIKHTEPAVRKPVPLASPAELQTGYLE